MKSQQAKEVDPLNADRYSELQVMQSAAGWYVGTMYHNPEFGGFDEPGSRDSGYFKTKKEATDALMAMIGGDLSEMRTRP